MQCLQARSPGWTRSVGAMAGNAELIAGQAKSNCRSLGPLTPLTMKL
jgi:hypothetical protein